MFCDSCDLGYHMDCLAPPLLSKPQGRWECSTCASHTGFSLAASVKVEVPLEEEFQAELPPLPPHILGCGWQERGLTMTMGAVSSEMVSWEQLPEDETVPDIARWSPARVSQYLVQQGIQESSAKVFFDQVSQQSLWGKTVWEINTFLLLLHVASLVFTEHYCCKYSNN